MEDRNQYVCDGISFLTEEEFLVAKDEKAKIQYIDKRVNYSDLSQALSLYNRLISEHTFKSPVGLFYVKRLYDYLYSKKDLLSDELEPIPPELSKMGWRRLDSSVTDSLKSPEEKKESIVFRVSIILNILLVIAIIAMFIISFNAEQPNIFNYEQNLQNKYASWEKELKEREDALSEAEKEYQSMIK